MDGLAIMIGLILYIVIIYFAIKEGGKKSYIKDNKAANMLIGGLLGIIFGLLGLIVLWVTPNANN